MRNKIIVVCLITFLGFLLMPLMINWLASIPNPYIKGLPNTVEATWISFWGSYGGGFFSALVGAGVSVTVAFFLIDKETKENRNSETIQVFSIKFNEDFQMTKKDIIQCTVDIHACLQNYHMKLFDDKQCFDEMYNILEKCKLTQIRLNQMVNIHILLLQYIREKNDDFSLNLLCDNYTKLVLQYNSIGKEYVKSLEKKTSYNLINEYNSRVVDKVNELRQLIIETEYNFIDILFPVLKTTKKFSLPKIQSITKTDHESLMKDFLIDK